MRVTNISNKGIDLIARWEGLKLSPYLCTSKIPTIGIGCTYYEDGTRVKMTDPAITKERAIELFRNVVVTYVRSVDSFTRDDINQNQFDSLVSLCYNIGAGALKKSTLIKKVNINPNNVLIKKEFLKYNISRGKVIKGLTNRRTDESKLYFS